MTAEPAPITFEGFGRLFRVFCAWVAVFAAVVGVALPLQFAAGLQKFGGTEYVPQVVALAVVRELAAGAVFAAGLFTWISLSHGLDALSTRARFRPMAAQLALAGVLGLPLALGVSTLVSAGVSYAWLGIGPARYLAASTAGLAANDYGAGIAALFEMQVLLIVTGWLSVPFVAALKWKLQYKLLATWAALAVVRLGLAILDTVLRAA